MQSWFVYYKVPTDAAADVMVCAQQVADGVKSLVGMPPRIMRKLDGAQVVTVMEVYDQVRDPEVFEEALAAAVAAAGFSQWPEVARRVERFVPATPAESAVPCA